MITGVVGITLWTDDLERMFRFYNDLLQLPLHSRHPDFIAFELGDIRFNIGLHGEVKGGSQDPYRFRGLDRPTVPHSLRPQHSYLLLL